MMKYKFAYLPITLYFCNFVAVLGLISPDSLQLCREFLKVTTQY